MKAAGQGLPLQALWILQLLATGVGTQRRAPVAGRTRMMKLLFLFGQQGSAPNFYEFRSGNYGPTCDLVLRHLHLLQERGLVNRTDEMGGSYYITDDGLAALATATPLPDPQVRRLAAIKERFYFVPLPKLLYHVYAQYPKFTDKSLIRDQVLGEDV